MKPFRGQHEMLETIIISPSTNWQFDHLWSCLFALFPDHPSGNRIGFQPHILCKGTGELLSTSSIDLRWYEIHWNPVFHRLLVHQSPVVDPHNWIYNLSYLQHIPIFRGQEYLRTMEFSEIETKPPAISTKVHAPASDVTSSFFFSSSFSFLKVPWVGYFVAGNLSIWRIQFMWFSSHSNHCPTSWIWKWWIARSKACWIYRGSNVFSFTVQFFQTSSNQLLRSPSNRDLPPTPCTSFIPHGEWTRATGPVSWFSFRSLPTKATEFLVQSLWKKEIQQNHGKSVQWHDPWPNLAGWNPLEGEVRLEGLGWEVATKCSTEKSIEMLAYLNKQNSSISVGRNLIGHY